MVGKVVSQGLKGAIKEVPQMRQTAGRSSDMELDKALNTLLVKLFRDIMNIEEEVLISGDARD